MRDIALLSGFLAMLMIGRVFRYPHTGVLLWCWTAMVVPNTYVYGFAAVIPFNKIIAIITLLAWLLSNQNKRIPLNATVVLMIIFGALGTLSALFGIAKTDVTMAEWEKFIKIIVFFFVVTGIISTKNQIDALLYAIFLSLGFHGIVSGAKFFASAGGHHVYGPQGSIIGDNNHFALAMIALLPIIAYLYRQTTTRTLRLALIGSGILTVFTVMGTFSRGGLLGIAAVGALAFLRSKKKLSYLAIVIPLIVAAIAFAPERWSSRMDTIATANQDHSFMGRVIAWKQSTLIAIDHPLLGGGFHAVQDFYVWTHYAATKFSQLDFISTDFPDPFAAHAAHSVYFQVLGDLGFLGLLIFLAILISAWRNASVVIRKTRQNNELRWAHDLSVSLQYSLMAYMISGAALSLAYFDFVYMVFAVLVVLRKMLSEQEAKLEKPGSSI